MPAAVRRALTMLRRVGVIRGALGHDGPVVVNVPTSLEYLSTYSTLTSLAAAGTRS